MAEISFQDFVDAIEDQESEGSKTTNPRQIQRNTFERFKRGKESWDNPKDRIAVSNRYVNHFRKITGGNPSYMAATYIGGEGGLDKKNWGRTDKNGKSISSYVSDVEKRLANKQTASMDDELSKLPDEDLDKELSSLPDEPITEQPTTFMGYTPQELYQGAKVPAEVVGGMAGGALGTTAGPPGMVLGAGLGSLAANRAHQALGQTLGLLPEETPTQALSTSINTLASGAAGEAGGQILAKAASKAVPAIGDLVRNWIAGKPTASAVSDTIETGISLTAPEGSGKGVGWQKVLSSVPGSETKFAEKYTQQMERAAHDLEFHIDRLASQTNLTKEVVGQRAINAYDDVVNNAFKARTTQGRADFAITDAMMRERPYIRLDTFYNELRSVIAELGASAVPAKVARARALSATYRRMQRMYGDKVTGFALNAQMADFGAAARGSGKLFANLESDAYDKVIAGRIFGALDADLGIAANNLGTMQGAVGESLEVARSNWRTNTQYINELRDNVVGRMLNTGKQVDPTTVYNRITTLPPATMRQVANVLDTLDPSVMNDVRARALQDILETSISKQGADVGSVDATKLYKTIEKNPERLRALFSPKDYEHLNAVSRQMHRIIKTGGGKPNKTIERIAYWSGGGIAIYPALYGNFGQALVHAGITGGLVLTASQLARVLTATESRVAMQTILKANPQPSQVVRALSQIVSHMDRDDAQNFQD